MSFRNGWFWLAVLVGCMSDPKGPSCGNSVGCGNPIKTAELHPLSQNTCGNSDDCSGAWPPTVYHVIFGESLSISLMRSSNPLPDSSTGMLYLFEGDQIPVFDKSPVDSVRMQDYNFRITQNELTHLRRRGEGDSSYSTFSAYVRLSHFKMNVEYSQAGLLAGLVYDWNFGEFSYSNHNPLALADSSHSFAGDHGGWYKGILSIPDSIQIGAGAWYVYVPGSPFFTIVNGSNRKFSLGPLPIGEAYELRFFAMPITNKHGDTVPVFRLESDSGTDSNRVFQVRDLKETITLP